MDGGAGAANDSEADHAEVGEKGRRERHCVIPWLADLYYGTLKGNDVAEGVDAELPEIRGIHGESVVPRLADLPKAATEVDDALEAVDAEVGQ